MFRSKPIREVVKRLVAVGRWPAHAPPASEPRNSPDQLSVDELLARHAALVRRIRMAYGHADTQFHQHLLAPIESLAAWIHLLPGHPGGGFEHKGGAIEQALTNCLFSLQAADGRTFGAFNAQARPDDATQRWRLACALGGLFATLPHVLSSIEVVSPDGSLWPASSVPLLRWLGSLPAAKYRYRWIAHGEDLRWPGIYAASRCIEPDVMSFLSRGDAQASAALFRSIAACGTSGHDAVSEIVSTVAVAVAARERPRSGSQEIAWLASTLRRLLGTSDWLPNSPGGHVWFGTDGLFLLWPDAGAKLLEAAPPGPRIAMGSSCVDDVLCQLASSGIVHASPSALTSILPPGQTKPQSAICVANGDRMLNELGLRVTPLALQLRAPIDRALGQAELDLDLAHGTDSRSRRTGSASTFAPAAEAAGAAGLRAECTKVLEAAEDSAVTCEPLTLDSSGITNPRSRDLVDRVVDRLEESFDTMLSKAVPGGVFVALSEFGGHSGDAAAIVRSLHEARLLAVDERDSHRRVHRERIEGADIAGVVLAAEAFRGYSAWVARWQDGTRRGAAAVFD